MFSNRFDECRLLERVGFIKFKDDLVLLRELTLFGLMLSRFLDMIGTDLSLLNGYNKSNADLLALCNLFLGIPSCSN
jgi:hypothetical protein